MKDIFNDITKTFGSLWHCIQRGNTMEIVTPYATINHSFISVFITKQGDEYIVTDSGWISSNEYEANNKSDKMYLRLFDFYLNEYGIKKIEVRKTIYYFKHTKSPIFIPNLVFDLCAFISSVTNASFIQFEDVKEKTEQSRFKSAVDSYVLSISHPDRVKFNSVVDDDFKDLKFNAVIQSGKSSLYLISYVTGSTKSYFGSNLAKARTNIDIIQSAPISRHVKGYIAMINNNAPGYNEGSYFNALKNTTGDKVISWTSREQLSELIH